MSKPDGWTAPWEPMCSCGRSYAECEADPCGDVLALQGKEVAS